MGLDLSMTGTGLVVLRSGMHRPLKWTLLRTEPTKTGEERTKPSGIFVGCNEARVNFIARQIFIMWKRYQPDLVVIEQQAFSKALSHAKGTGELHGVVKHRLWLNEAPFHLQEIRQVKKHATGNGNASKTMMVDAAKQAWPEFPTNLPAKQDENVADSYWLADFGRANFAELVEAA